MRRLAAIQAQYSASVPLAIWARNPRLSAYWVKAALFEKRTLIKTWCLRGTVHVLASADLAMIVQAVGEQQLTDFEYFMKTRRGVDGQQIQSLKKAIFRALAQRPLNRSELHEAVPELANIEGASWGLDVKGLAFMGALVLADSYGVETLFARRDVWLFNLSWEPPSQANAQRELLLRYLTAYGPSTMQDFAHWSGLKMKTVQIIFAACVQELISVEVTGWREGYYLRRQDEPLLKADGEEPSAICLLPKFDPLLMGYKDKTRFIDEENLSRVYRPAGQIEAVVLLQGRAMATWRTSFQGVKLRLTVTPFRRLVWRELTLVKSTVEQLAAFFSAKGLDLAIQS
ncbi:MAG: AlkZ family DNA glycosylase [Planctomycetes bacterium]|nr:AlkZ family DNA glycosylase [Planctomycetota bacterium]